MTANTEDVKSGAELAKALAPRELEGGLPLFTESPRRLILGNPDSYARISIRCRGVGKRACSVSFLEEFFSESPGFR